MTAYGRCRRRVRRRASSRGFFLMVGIGFLHRAWWDQLPTMMGYWTAALTVFLLRGVFSGNTNRAAEPTS